MEKSTKESPFEQDPNDQSVWALRLKPELRPHEARYHDRLVIRGVKDPVRNLRGGDVPVPSAREVKIDNMGRDVKSMVLSIAGECAEIARGVEGSKAFTNDSAETTQAFLDRGRALDDDQSMERLEDKSELLTKALSELIDRLEPAQLVGFFNNDVIMCELLESTLGISIMDPLAKTDQLSGRQKAHRNRRIAWQNMLLEITASKFAKHLADFLEVDTELREGWDKDPHADNLKPEHTSQGILKDLELKMISRDGVITLQAGLKLSRNQVWKVTGAGHVGRIDEVTPVEIIEISREPVALKEEVPASI